MLGGLCLSHAHGGRLRSAALGMAEPQDRAGFSATPEALAFPPSPPRPPWLPPLCPHSTRCSDLSLAVNGVPRNCSCAAISPFTCVLSSSLWLGTQYPLDIHLFIRIGTESTCESHIRTGHVKAIFQYSASSSLKHFSQVQLWQSDIKAHALPPSVRKLSFSFCKPKACWQSVTRVTQLHGSSF